MHRELHVYLKVESKTKKLVDPFLGRRRGGCYLKVFFAEELQVQH